MKKLRCTIFIFLEFCQCISFAIWHLNSLIISGGSIWPAHTLGQFLIRGLTLNQIMLKDLLSPWRRKDFSFIHFSVHHFLSPFLFYDLALSLYDVSPLVWFLMWLIQKMFFFRPTFGHFSKSCGFQKNTVVWK